MILQGTLVNMAAVAIGCGAGLVIGKGIPERASDNLQKGLGLCTLYIGISGALVDVQILAVVLSMAVGALIGGLADLDGMLRRLGDMIQEKMKMGGKSSVSDAFVSASLLFCVGAMSIVGSIQSGLGDHGTIYTKSLLDGVMAVVFTSRFGFGVIFSCGAILVYQGFFEILASVVGPYMTDPLTALIACVGSIIIAGLGLNMIGAAKIKVMNLVPAIFDAVPVYYLFEWIAKLNA